MEKTKYRGIYLRKNKDGTTSYYLRCTLNGRRKLLKAGSTLDAAKTYQRDLEETKRRRKSGVIIPKRITFSDLADKYFEDLRRRHPDSDYARVRSVIKKLKAEFGPMQVSAIEEEDIDAANFPREDLIYLKAMLQKARRWNYLGEVPEIDLPAKAAKLDRVITGEELNKILSQSSELHRDAILLSLSLGGMRLGELTKITRENTDFEKGTVELQKRKANVPKRYALGPSAAAILRRRFMQNGGKAFVESPPKLAQAFFYERRAMKDVKPWRFHDLRHTVTEILKGIDVETLREILGHTSINTTSMYMHSTLEEQRKAIERIDDYLEKIGTAKF